MNKILMNENEIETTVEKIVSMYQNHTQHMFIDITGDLISGTLLSQILYWFTKDKNGNSKVRIFKDGYYWIAKNRGDWYDEIRITKRQYDVAINLLLKKDFVKLAKYKYNSMPTIHIRPNYDAINLEIKKWKDTVRKGLTNGNVNEALREEYEDNFGKTKKSKLKKPGNYKNVNPANDENVNTGITNEETLLTMTTNNDYLTEITNINAFNSDELKVNNIHAFCDVTRSEARIPYINPDNCTKQEFHDFILAKSMIFCKKHQGNDKGAIELTKIIEYFYEQYEKEMGEKHPILSDKVFENVVIRYLYPPELLDSYGVYDFEYYQDMIDKYFKIDYGRHHKKKYGEEISIELSLPHFMSDTIRENLFKNTSKIPY